MNFSINPRALRTLAVAVASLALMAGSAEAQGRSGGGAGGHGAHASHGGGRGGFAHGGHFAPRYRYYGRGPGWGWGVGGLGLGLGLGWGLSNYYYDDYPGYVMLPPPAVGYGTVQPVPTNPDPASTQPTAPVIYPRNGQDARQMDSDSNQCSEWAGQQPGATANRSVFQRGIEACMDARGYTLR